MDGWILVSDVYSAWPQGKHFDEDPDGAAEERGDRRQLDWGGTIGTGQRKGYDAKGYSIVLRGVIRTYGGPSRPHHVVDDIVKLLLLERNLHGGRIVVVAGHADL